MSCKRAKSSGERFWSSIDTRDELSRKFFVQTAIKMRHLQLPCRLDKSDAAAPMPPPPLPPFPLPHPIHHQRNRMIYYPPFTHFRNQQHLMDSSPPFYGGMCSAFRAYGNALSPFLAATAGRFVSTTPSTNSNAVSEISPISCSSSSPFSTVAAFQTSQQQQLSESKARLSVASTTAEEIAATLSRLIPQRPTFGAPGHGSALSFENGKRTESADSETERKRSVETQFPMPQELLPLMPLITSDGAAELRSRNYALQRSGPGGESLSYHLGVSNVRIACGIHRF